ncbi:MAG: hypothetical protein AAB433_22650 [Nitrospirota bacterium]
MRPALVLSLLFLSDYSIALAGGEVMSFPSSPAAQACHEHMPSPSKDPEGFLLCLDIVEGAAPDRWKAMYVAKHPDTKACRDNPPSPSDPARVSLCFTLIDQEDTAVAHYKDKLRVDFDLLRKRVNERAAKKAARRAERLNPPLGLSMEAEIERLDYEIEQLEAGTRSMFSAPSFPMMREPITCMSYPMGRTTYTDCY